MSAPGRTSIEQYHQLRQLQGPWLHGLLRTSEPFGGQSFAKSSFRRERLRAEEVTGLLSEGFQNGVTNFLTPVFALQRFSMSFCVPLALWEAKSSLGRQQCLRDPLRSGAWQRRRWRPCRSFHPTMAATWVQTIMIRPMHLSWYHKVYHN